MRCCSRGGLCLFYCYQRSCVVELILGFLKKNSNFTPPPPPGMLQIVDNNGLQETLVCWSEQWSRLETTPNNTVGGGVRLNGVFFLTHHREDFIFTPNRKRARTTPASMCSDWACLLATITVCWGLFSYSIIKTSLHFWMYLATFFHVHSLCMFIVNYQYLQRT